MIKQGEEDAYNVERTKRCSLYKGGSLVAWSLAANSSTGDNWGVKGSDIPAIASDGSERSVTIALQVRLNVNGSQKYFTITDTITLRMKKANNTLL